MRIKRRDLTNKHLCFLRAWTLNTGCLVTVVFLSFIALKGKVDQTIQRVEITPSHIQTSPSLSAALRDGVQSQRSPAVIREIEGQASSRESIAGEAQTGRSATPETGYPHVEVSLSRQRLFVIDGAGHMVKTLPISSGNGKWFTSEGRRRRAITPRGRFTVYRKIAGWRESPLGRLYYPNYITEGVAIHGSPSVPSRPASHGCIRIPMSAAKQFSD